MPPIAILLGLGAVVAAVMLSTKSASASGGGSAPQPSTPADCEAERQVLGQRALEALQSVETGCAGKTDPVCAAVVSVIDQLKVQFKIALSMPWDSTDPKSIAAQRALISILTAGAPKIEALCKASPSDLCTKLETLGADLQPAMNDWMQRCHPEDVKASPTRDLVATAPTPLLAGLAALANVLYHQAQAGVMNPLSTAAATTAPTSTTTTSLPGNLGGLGSVTPPSGTSPQVPNVPQVGGACPPGFIPSKKGDCQWDGVVPNADGSCNPGYDIGDDGWCHLVSGVDPKLGLSRDGCEELVTAYNQALDAYNTAKLVSADNPLLEAQVPALEAAMTAAEQALARCNQTA